MFYGIVTQQIPDYTERQLRAYPQLRQRIEDGAQPVPASRISAEMRRQLRTPGLAHLSAGGILSTIITKAEAEALKAN
jgi:hypothetical protein